MTETGKLLLTGALVAAFAAIVVKSAPEKTKEKIRGIFGPGDRTGEECDPLEVPPKGYVCIPFSLRSPKLEIFVLAKAEKVDELGEERIKELIREHRDL